MSTLYTQSESNSRKTWFLLFGFLILVIGLGYVFSYIFDNYWILVIAVVISVVQAVTSYWYSDKIVLSMSRAKPAKKEEYPELYRLVENLCITAGLPMPKIYIMGEKAPNAFTTGRDKEHAIVVVTTGLLDKLERVELEGVIAHELSHIGNKDMLIGTVVVVLVGVIALLSRFFLYFGLLGDRKGSGGGSGGGVMMLLGIIAAVLAPLAAFLIKAAVSRKREFLADSEGALLTRYPEGLAGALEKISNTNERLKGATTSTAHLYITNPFTKKQKNWFRKMFSSHPPVKERVKALRNINIE